ncbi:MAG: RnfABCDGE type electron transport complex subunit G, partial [Mariniphaga sp.]
MAKRESTFFNMVLTLFAVTFIAAAALGFVYDYTKEAIELAKIRAQNEAIEKVLPDFDTLGESYKVALNSSDDSLEFFPAYKDDQRVGVAIRTFTNNGFSGYISIMAGIDSSGNIAGFEVLEHAETPGLGSKMNEWFKDEQKPSQNVIGKSPETHSFKVAKDGGDFDAITASTITSRAFLEALERAYDAYEKNLNKTTANAV